MTNKIRINKNHKVVLEKSGDKIHVKKYKRKTNWNTSNQILIGTDIISLKDIPKKYYLTRKEAEDDRQNGERIYYSAHNIGYYIIKGDK